MDTLRGYFSGSDSGDDREYDLAEDDVGSEPPPSPVGQDERRMQVRAYNFWASLLSDRQFPAIDELNPQDLPDFGPYSVLLDFTVGVDNPAIRYLGAELRRKAVQSFLKSRIARRKPGPDAAAREGTPVFVWGEAADSAGRLVTARVRVPNGYTLTRDAAVAVDLAKSYMSSRRSQPVA